MAVARSAARDAIAELAGGGKIDAGLIDALRQDGVDAAPLINQLANGSDEQLAKLDELYGEAGASATQQFADQLVSGAPVLVAAGEQLGQDTVDAIVSKMLEGKDTLAQIVRDYGLIVEGIAPAWEGAFNSTGTEVRDSSAAVIRASNSSRKRPTAEAIGAVADGPRGQIVVCFGGQTSPGEMLSQTSISNSRSLGRPLPSRMRPRMRSSQVVPSRHGVHLPQDSRA